MQVFVCIYLCVHCMCSHTFASVENSCLCSDNGARLMKSLWLRKLVFPGKSLWGKTGSRTEVLASVRILLCFTVLHHLNTIPPRYEIQ